MKNIQNERAAFAYERVKKVMATNKNAEFFTLARSAPAEVQMSGLSTLVSVLFSKTNANSSQKLLYEIIRDWLKTRRLITGDDLVEAITQADIGNYRLLTNETQQLLVWVKRFAEGMKRDE